MENSWIFISRRQVPWSLCFFVVFFYIGACIGAGAFIKITGVNCAWAWQTSWVWARRGHAPVSTSITQPSSGHIPHVSAPHEKRAPQQSTVSTHVDTMDCNMSMHLVDLSASTQRCLYPAFWFSSSVPAQCLLMVSCVARKMAFTSQLVRFDISVRGH